MIIIGTLSPDILPGVEWWEVNWVDFCLRAKWILILSCILFLFFFPYLIAPYQNHHVFEWNFLSSLNNNDKLTDNFVSVFFFGCREIYILAWRHFVALFHVKKSFYILFFRKNFASDNKSSNFMSICFIGLSLLVVVDVFWLFFVEKWCWNTSKLNWELRRQKNGNCLRFSVKNCEKFLCCVIFLRKIMCVFCERLIFGRENHQKNEE